MCRVVDTLPRRVADIPILLVRCHGVDNTHADFRVCRARVLNALQWLQANNRFYHDIHIDFSALQGLPADNIPSSVPHVQEVDQCPAAQQHSEPHCTPQVRTYYSMMHIPFTTIVYIYTPMLYCCTLQVASTSAHQPTITQFSVAQCSAAQQHSAGHCLTAQQDSTGQSLVALQHSTRQCPAAQQQSHAHCTPQVRTHYNEMHALSTILCTSAILLHFAGG